MQTEKRTSYVLRNIPASLWRSVKISAAKRGETVRAALLRYLTNYAAGQK